MPATLDRAVVKQHLDAFDLRSLFTQELGWDYGGSDTEVTVKDRAYPLQAIVQKSGFVVYLYIAQPGDEVPDHATRQKIERSVARQVREHLIIFCPHDRSAQYWLWVKREPGRTERSRTHIHYSGHSGESLIQKLEQIVFTLDEEADITIVDPSSRVRAAFDVEKVTKRFYDRFNKEHQAFLGFIEGINNIADREWYASLMLNRMMFIYFIQKRRFLDGNTDYLRDRLHTVRQQHGAGRFAGFYRLFLLKLFHEGLGQPEGDRDRELTALLGQVPYLNGGLFDVHDLERDHPDIDIPDQAFENIFAFFDAYQWHLDDRPLRNDNEINPDVLGYIFEKYINQKQMGAYYTKEDITGYISRNTIIPFLFDRAKKECSTAFTPGGGVWRLLQEDPDGYFYDAVRHGITYDINKNEPLDQKQKLPPDIAAGLKNVNRRHGWTEPAPKAYALPTETWREHVARRRRYEEIYAKLAAGEVTSINDLITYNLNIEKFAQDVIANSEGPELVRAFWKALEKVSVLDPTCGSGAFLFAALNILEPLYSACLEAMDGFLDDLKRSQRPHSPKKLSDFHKILDHVAEHASPLYFILKSIIINNLYGVDIMEEAVEICKLRLFLKLVAQLETYDQIEPLPDIDFNVRAGNTLVGFASLDEVKRAMMGDWIKEQALPDIEERAELADRAFTRFREMQTDHGMDAVDFADAKLELRERLDALRAELDHQLATGEYGVKECDEEAYAQWKTSHQPFHWFVEFYGIMHKGGFDVIVGNPPYVSAKKVLGSYSVRYLKTLVCPDIYAWVLERTANMIGANGCSGMIVPLSLGFSSKFDVCRRFLFDNYDRNWFSSFGRIPDNLFGSDVRVRNTVHLGHRTAKPIASYSSRLHRWFSEERATLFDNIQYVPFQPELWDYLVPKLNTQPLAKAFEVAMTRGKVLGLSLRRQSKHRLFFKQTAYNWLTVCRDLPPCYKGENQVPHSKVGNLYFADEDTCALAMLLASGKLMLTYWLCIGDDFDLTKSNLASFPADLDSLPEPARDRLLALLPDVKAAMKDAIQYKANAGRRVGTYNLAKCRHVTDRSDALFASALGFDEVLEDIELYYAQAIRTDFGE